MITQEYVDVLTELMDTAKPAFEKNPTMTNPEAFKIFVPLGYSKSAIRRVMTALRRGCGIDPTQIRYRVPDFRENPPAPEDIAPIKNEVREKQEIYRLAEHHIEQTAMYIRAQYERIYNRRKLNGVDSSITAEIYVNGLDMSERKRTRLLSVASSYAQAQGWIPVYAMNNR